MSKWEKVKLGDVATFNYGKMPKKELLNVGDYPTFSGYKYQYTYPEKNCEEGDLIVVARGVGGTGDVKIVKQQCYLTNIAIKIILNKSIIDTIYFYYKYLLSNLKYLDTGSAQSQITINDLKKLEFSLPPLEEQKRIATILSSLDDKIEVNNQINKNLEEQAQAIFTSWFVDFEPFQDGEFIESELGKIPKGWKIKKLGDFIKVKHGFAFKSEFFSDKPTDTILTTPGNFNIGGGIKLDKFKYYNGSIPQEYVFSPSDLAITMTDLSKEGDTLGFPAFIPSHKTFLHNQRIGKVVFHGSHKFYNFLHLFCCSTRYRESILGSATGSTVRHTAPSRIESIQFPYKETIISKFNQTVQPFFEKKMLLMIENEKLIECRNALLPKLMNGEIDA